MKKKKLYFTPGTKVVDICTSLMMTKHIALELPDENGNLGYLMTKFNESGPPKTEVYQSIIETLEKRNEKEIHSIKVVKAPEYHFTELAWIPAHITLHEENGFLLDAHTDVSTGNMATIYVLLSITAFACLGLIVNLYYHKLNYDLGGLILFIAFFAGTPMYLAIAFYYLSSRVSKQLVKSWDKVTSNQSS